MTLDVSRIAQDLQLRKVQVENVVQLLDEGNPPPFIARYRKERTGGLPEDLIRKIKTRVSLLRKLAERKQSILKSLETQGKLTEELRSAIEAAETVNRLEDLYLPFKPKKQTPATVARERGLEPLAQAIWDRDPAVANLDEVVAGMVNPDQGLTTSAEVLHGVHHILAEKVAETADIRAAVRSLLWETGKLTTSRSESLKDGEGLEYKDYFQFAEPVRHIPAHRVLAINRGEREGSLKVQLTFDTEAVRRALFDSRGSRSPLVPLSDHPHADFLRGVVEDALWRLLVPSLEREIRRELTEEALDHAAAVFARNFRSILMQPPLRGTRVLAIDPGLRTGCKVAVLDEAGNLLADTTIYPHPPQNRRAEALGRLAELIDRHGVTVIAIGNGTAGRETEELIAELIAAASTTGEWVHQPEPPRARPAAAARSKPSAAPQPQPAALAAAVTPAVPEPQPIAAPEQSAAAPEPQPTSAVQPEPSVAPGTPPAADLAPAAPSPTTPPPIRYRLPADLAYALVNEAGASAYAVSPIGREEFPHLDTALRSAISIGRRLQDPLSELVKIDPQSVGVGLYQHDVDPRELRHSLEAVLESCVNQVGVDVNRATMPLLRYVSGLNQVLARALVEYRQQHGPFRTREQLKEFPGMTENRFLQAAGFLRIVGGDNPLDQTWIHPESYPIALRLLGELGFELQGLTEPTRRAELSEKLQALSPEEVASRLGAGATTVKDIIDALCRPGWDPRDELPRPILKKSPLKLEHLQPGMELRGTVVNVVDFGAFVDIGLKDSGLVHISQMANRFLRSPYDAVSVGSVVTVWVLAVDQERHRVSLTMIPPGTPRKAPERKPTPERKPASERREAVRPPQPAGVAERGGRGRPGGRPGGAGGRRAPARAPRGNQHGYEERRPPREEPAAATAEAALAEPTPERAVLQPPAPRKPSRPQPELPKLSDEALRGKVPLRTFRELAAFFRSPAAQASGGTPTAAPSEASSAAAEDSEVLDPIPPSPPSK
ncbi:MAG: RNA-binding transcriptional accessory protein [Gemmataceae bacterium]|nr:RNA-binding transcriptional accessory protein [Gemmataceae bacterium]